MIIWEGLDNLIKYIKEYAPEFITIVELLEGEKIIIQHDDFEDVKILSHVLKFISIMNVDCYLSCSIDNKGESVVYPDDYQINQINELSKKIESLSKTNKTIVLPAKKIANFSLN